MSDNVYEDNEDELIGANPLSGGVAFSGNGGTVLTANAQESDPGAENEDAKKTKG